MKTLTHSEDNKGWTSFLSMEPDGMASMNNNFFTVKNGNLFLQNAENVNRNRFFETQYKSKVVTVINISPQDDKIYKALIIEGTNPWDVSLKTNYTEGTIDKGEFKAKESRWFAYIRQNENTSDLSGNAAQGIGTLLSINDTVLTVSSVPDQVSVGDALFFVNEEIIDIVGFITEKTATTIKVDSVITEPLEDMFLFSKKPNRIEGGEIRGYYLEVELTNELTKPVELFAINVNLSKSYV